MSHQPAKRGRGLARIITSSVQTLLFTFPLAAAGAAPSSASAGDGVKYQRKGKRVRGRTTLNTRVDKAKAKAERDKKQARPSGKAPTAGAPRQAVTLAVLDQQIRTLHKLIRLEDPKDVAFVDLHFRLADHHLAMKEIFEFQAGHLYEKIYDRQESGDKSGARQLKAKQDTLLTKVRDQSKHAVKAYATLAKSPGFLKFKKQDAALYFLAFELGQLGKTAKMQDVYVKLLQEYPTSPFIPHVYLSFGDLKFGAGEIDSALKLYQKIVDGYPSSPVYAYALYKIAWCHLNPSGGSPPQYDRSLDSFVASIKATLQGKAGSKENAKQLRRDSRRDLVRAYAHAGRPSRAWDFMRKVGDGPKTESMSRKMMELLAAAYFGEGMYVESNAIYHKLQEEFEGDPMTCEWQGKVVVNALATDDAGIQWKESERLADYWRAFASSKVSKKDKKRCRDRAHETLVQMATVWHDEADKTRREETYERANLAYVSYLDLFAEAKMSYEMQAYQAELLWLWATQLTNGKNADEVTRGRQKFLEAHKAFVALLERNPKGKHAKDAAYAQMLAAKNYLDYDETGGNKTGCRMQTDGTCVYRERRRRRGPGTERVDAAELYPVKPYTDDEQMMLGAYKRYQTFIKDKKDPELPKILYHIAKLQVEHNRHGEAEPTLVRLVKEYDGTIYAAWSAEMLLDALTIKWSNDANSTEDEIKYGVELEKWARKLQRMKSFKHKEADRVREQVPILLSATRWKRADALCKKGDYADGGQLYFDIYHDFDRHDRGDELLWNAARCLQAAYLVGFAIRARVELLDRYPESKLAKETLKEVAGNYQAIAFYRQAAQRMEEFATKHKKDGYASEALHNAFLFRLGLGQEEQAEADLKRYESLYRRKDPKRAAGIFWAKHDLLGEEDQQLKHAKEYIARYGKKGGGDRLAVAHAAIGQILWRRSCGVKMRHDSCISIKRRKATAGEGRRGRVSKLRRRIKGVPKRCGEETQAIIKVHERDDRLAAEAAKHFSEVIKAAGRKPEVPKGDGLRADAFKDAWGMALVYGADRKYEEYLGLDMPENLDFGTDHMWKKDFDSPKLQREYKAAMKRREDTQRRFKAFFDRKVSLGRELTAAYGAVTKTGSKHWTLAASARVALLSQNLADQLYRAPVPKAIRTIAMYDDYCDEIGDRAQETQKLAKQAFDYCLDRSTKFQFFNEYSRLCESELQQRDADKYPATNELFGTATYTEGHMHRVPVQRDVEGEKPGARPKKRKAPKGKPIARR